jgi:hypothetical protein
MHNMPRAMPYCLTYIPPLPVSQHQGGGRRQLLHAVHAVRCSVTTDWAFFKFYFTVRGGVKCLCVHGNASSLQSAAPGLGMHTPLAYSVQGSGATPTSSSLIAFPAFLPLAKGGSREQVGGEEGGPEHQPACSACPFTIVGEREHGPVTPSDQVHPEAKR